MKFMLTYDWAPDTEARAEAISRVNETGARPPAGIRLAGPWTRADFSGGYVLVETDDARALTELDLQWSDLMELGCNPVVEDQELSEVLQRVR